MTYDRMILPICPYNTDLCANENHPECHHEGSGMCHCGMYGWRSIDSGSDVVEWGLMSEAWWEDPDVLEERYDQTQREEDSLPRCEHGEIETYCPVCEKEHLDLIREQETIYQENV